MEELKRDKVNLTQVNIQAKVQVEESQKLVEDSARALEGVREFLSHPAEVQNKAMMFDAMLEGGLKGEDKVKVASFIVARSLKMEPTLQAMRKLVNNLQSHVW